MRKLIYVLLFLSFSWALPLKAFPSLEKAEKLLNSALEQKTEVERNTLIQQALTQYLSLTKQDGFSHNPWLYYNIGNAYFHSKEYAFALLYYYKAKKNAPREQKIDTNIHVVEKMLGISEETYWQEGLWSFLLLSFLSKQEQAHVLIFLSLCAFMCFSFLLYFSNKYVKKLAFVCLCLSFYLTPLYFIDFFTQHNDAIVLKESHLHHEPKENYYRNEAPVLKKGMKVVIMKTKDKNWLKVRLTSGEVGFLPVSSLGII